MAVTVDTEGTKTTTPAPQPSSGRPAGQGPHPSTPAPSTSSRDPRIWKPEVIGNPSFSVPQIPGFEPPKRDANFWFQQKVPTGDFRSHSEMFKVARSRMRLDNLQRIEYIDRASGGMLPSDLVMGAAESSLDDWDALRAAQVMARQEFLPMATWFAPFGEQGDGLVTDRMTGEPLSLAKARRLYAVRSTRFFEQLFNAPYDPNTELQRGGRGQAQPLNPFGKVDPMKAARVYRSMRHLQGDGITWEDALGWTSMVAPTLRTSEQINALDHNIQILAADEILNERDVLIIAHQAALMNFRFDEDPLSPRHPLAVLAGGTPRAERTVPGRTYESASNINSARMYISWYKARQRHREEIRNFRLSKAQGQTPYYIPEPDGPPVLRDGAPGLSQQILEQQKVIQGLLTDEDDQTVASGLEFDPVFTLTEEERNSLTGSQRIIADLAMGTKTDYTNNWQAAIGAVRSNMVQEDFAAHGTLIGQAKDLFGEALRLVQDIPRADAYAIWGAIDWAGTSIGNLLRDAVGKEPLDQGDINEKFADRLRTSYNMMLHPDHDRYDLQRILVEEENIIGGEAAAFAVTLGVDLAFDPLAYALKYGQIRKLKSLGLSDEMTASMSRVNWNLWHRVALKPEIRSLQATNITESMVQAMKTRHIMLGRRTIPGFLLDAAAKYDNVTDFRWWAVRRLRNVAGDTDALPMSLVDIVYRVGKLHKEGELARYGIKTAEDAENLITELMVMARVPGKKTPKVLREIVGDVNARRNVGTVKQVARLHRKHPNWVTPWTQWDETADADEYVEALKAYESAQGVAQDTVIGGERLMAVPQVKNPLSVGWLRTKESMSESRALIGSRYRRSIMASSMAELEGGQLPKWAEQVMLRSKGLFTTEEIAEKTNQALQIQSKLGHFRERRFVAFVMALQDDIVRKTAQYYGADAKEIEDLLEQFRIATHEFNQRLFGADPKAIERAFIKANGDPDAYVNELNKAIGELRHPQMVTQLTNRWMMMDPVRIREIVAEAIGYNQKLQQSLRRISTARVPGTLLPVTALPEAKLKELTVNMITKSWTKMIRDSYLRFWKASVVATPRYVLRVPLGDEQMRFLWDVGGMQWMASRRIAAMAKRKLTGRSGDEVVVDMLQDAYEQLFEQAQRLGTNFDSWDEMVAAHWRIQNGMPLAGDVDGFNMLPADLKNSIETAANETLAHARELLKKGDGVSPEDFDPEWVDNFTGPRGHSRLAVSNIDPENPEILVNLDAFVDKDSFRNRVANWEDTPDDALEKVGPLSKVEEKNLVNLRKQFGSPKKLRETIERLRQNGDLAGARARENTLRYFEGLENRASGGVPPVQAPTVEMPATPIEAPSVGGIKTRAEVEAATPPAATAPAAGPGHRLRPGFYNPIPDAVPLNRIEDIGSADRIVVIGSSRYGDARQIDRDLDAIAAAHADLPADIVAQARGLGVEVPGRKFTIVTSDRGGVEATVRRLTGRKGLNRYVEERTAAGAEYFRQAERLMGTERAEVIGEIEADYREELSELGLLISGTEGGASDADIARFAGQISKDNVVLPPKPQVVVAYLGENWEDDQQLLHALAYASAQQIPVVIRGKKVASGQIGKIVQKYVDEAAEAYEESQLNRMIQGPSARFGVESDVMRNAKGQEVGTRKVGVEFSESNRAQGWNDPKVRLSIKAQARLVEKLEDLDGFLAGLDPELIAAFKRDLYAEMRRRNIPAAFDVMKSIQKGEIDKIPAAVQREVMSILNGSTGPKALENKLWRTARQRETPSFGTRVVPESSSATHRILNGDPDYVYIDGATGWPTKENFQEWASDEGNFQKVRELAGRKLVPAPGREGDAEFLRQLAEDYALEDFAPVKALRKRARAQGVDTEEWIDLGQVFAEKTPENPLTVEQYLDELDNTVDLETSVRKIWGRLSPEEQAAMVDDFDDQLRRWLHWAQEQVAGSTDVTSQRLRQEINDVKYFLRKPTTSAKEIANFIMGRPATPDGVRQVFFEWSKAFADDIRRGAEETGGFGETLMSRLGVEEAAFDGADRGYWLHKVLDPKTHNSVPLTVDHEYGHHLLAQMPQDLRTEIEAWFIENRIMPDFENADDLYTADMLDEVKKRWMGLHPDVLRTEEQADSFREAHEVFADAWASYIHHPEELKKYDPELFAIFQRNEERFRGILNKANIKLKWVGAVKDSPNPRYTMHIPFAGDVPEQPAVAVGRFGENFQTQAEAGRSVLREMGRLEKSNERYWDEITPDKEQYWEALTHTLRFQVGRDATSQIILEGLKNGWGPDQITAEVVRRFTTSEIGIAEARRLNLTTEALIRHRAEKLQRMIRGWTMGGNPEVIEGILADLPRRKMKALLHDAAEAAPDAERWPVHGFGVQELFGNPNPAKKLWDKYTQYIFEKPTNNFSRHPYYRVWYRAYAQGMVEEMTKVDDLKWSPAVAQQIHAQAEAFAIRRTKKVMFDFREQSRFSEMVGFMIPFHQAWKEAWQVYGHLLNKNPAFAYQAYQVFRDMEQAGYMPKDPFSGARVIPMSNWFFQASILNAMFGGISNEDVQGGWSMNGPLQSLNFVFGSTFEIPTGSLAGNFPAPVPSTNPLMTSLTQNLLERSDGIVPDFMQLSLTRWAFQYGDVSSGGNLLRGLLPTYADHLLTGMGIGGDEGQINSIANDFIRLYEAQGITGQSLAADPELARSVAGKKFKDVESAQAWLAEHATVQSRDLFKWRALFSFISPIAPSIKFPTAALEAEFREITEKHDDYGKAIEIFSERYDGKYDMITIPTSMWAKADSLFPMPANQMTEQLFNSPGWSEFAKANPMWAFALLPPEAWEEDFDRALFVKQLESGFRTVADPLAFQQSSDVRQGWDAWRSAWVLHQEDVARLEEQGIPESSVTYQVLKQRFDQAVEDIKVVFPGWKESSDTIQRYRYDPWVEYNVAAALKSELFRGTTIGQGILAYQDLREQIRARMAGMNITTLTTAAAENYGLAAAFDKGKKEIERAYPGMDRVFDTFFNEDLYGIETKGDRLIAEVDEAGLLEPTMGWENQWYGFRDATRKMSPGPERDLQYLSMREMANEATKAWGYTYRNPMFVAYESMSVTEQDAYKLSASLRPMNYLSRFDREHVLGMDVTGSSEKAWLTVGKIDLLISNQRKATPLESFGNAYDFRDKVVRNLMREDPVFRKQVAIANEWGGLFWRTYELDKQEGTTGEIWRSVRNTLESMQQVADAGELHGSSDANPYNRAKWRAMENNFIDYIEKLKTMDPTFKKQWVHLEEETYTSLVEEFLPETYYRLGG